MQRQLTPPMQCTADVILPLLRTMSPSAPPLQTPHLSFSGTALVAFSMLGTVVAWACRRSLEPLVEAAAACATACLIIEHYDPSVMVKASLWKYYAPLLLVAHCFSLNGTMCGNPLETPHGNDNPTGTPNNGQDKHVSTLVASGLQLCSSHPT